MNERIRESLFKRYRLLSSRQSLRIVIGASGIHDPGWIPTEKDFLNLLKPCDWARLFQPDSIDAMLAEHVWEHLTRVEGKKAAQVCYRYLKIGGHLRVAVPDGLHPCPDYIKWVRPGGNGPGQRIIRLCSLIPNWASFFAALDSESISWNTSTMTEFFITLPGVPVMGKFIVLADTTGGIREVVWPLHR